MFNAQVIIDFEKYIELPMVGEKTKLTPLKNFGNKL